MKRLLVIGAGRSATTMIRYLLDHAAAEDWEVTVGDYDEALAQEKVGKHPRGRAIRFDATNAELRRAEISKVDLVISLLPAHMHLLPAMDCLEFGVHLVTASYVSMDMAALDVKVREAGLVFLNECGVDPGIDHMSTMEMLDRIADKGGRLHSYRSYCGALIAPESNNLWGYKFTWAPRNVILAGQGTAKYRKGGRERFIPYHHLFRRTEEIEVPGHGFFEAYANRDSLKYSSVYGMDGVDTLFRATLRMPGYCRMWDAFVQMGITDDSYRIAHSGELTLRDFIFSYVPRQKGLDDVESLAFYLDVPVDSEVMEKLLALDLLSDRKVGLVNATPAEVLESVLMDKWRFEPDDTDMVVMQHQLEYDLNGKRHRLVSSMVDKGLDQVETAISRTVGLPAAIAARLILKGRIDSRGVVLPILREFFQPILLELREHGIQFTEQEYLVQELTKV